MHAAANVKVEGSRGAMIVWTLSCREAQPREQADMPQGNKYHTYKACAVRLTCLVAVQAEISTAASIDSVHADYTTSSNMHVRVAAMKRGSHEVQLFKRSAMIHAVVIEYKHVDDRLSVYY